MLFGILPCCLDPLAVWASGWINVRASAIGAEDVAHWPYSVSLLLKWVTFLGSLHWPAGGADLGWVVFLLLSC